MSKIARKIQKIFASTAGTNQRGEIGSLAAGSAAYSTDPDTIQSLSQYLSGWFATSIGSASPCIEDMNSLDFVLSYNIAYLQQAGVAEWYTTTTYYIGSFASDGVGGIYYSLTDTNLNNALTDTTNWKKFGNPTVSAISISTVLTAADSQKVLNVTTASAALNITLPAVQSGLTVRVKDVGGVASLNNITIVRNASESIEGVAASFVCAADYGSWTFVCDGTNWYLN